MATTVKTLESVIHTVNLVTQTPEDKPYELEFAYGRVCLVKRVDSISYGINRISDSLTKPELLIFLQGFLRGCDAITKGEESNA